MGKAIAGTWIDVNGEVTEYFIEDAPIIQTEKDRQKQAEIRAKQKLAIEKENKVIFMKEYNKEISGNFIL